MLDFIEEVYLNTKNSEVNLLSIDDMELTIIPYNILGGK